ncbi:hypothetical protein [Pseudobacillus badius]|uniref:hypothetical protein n=1 Tax=Bacillus badius TaxID=1455 RepID=UPI0007B0563A|nr:hypothetical protein [Bacillus badius]KZN99803.1 hypothetical protein A4244_17580 [Bacillus badius]MED0666597.1 hypothetical protein [Bacillus badius]OCS85906.1 hypothetical protein A6M11_17595 [Bacillus badius]OVE51734.1 hypothetical protein B1A98_09230 [Bacillus badius]TDW03151.1 hypothetical protein B0G66_10455 [Bacillus badius]
MLISILLILATISGVYAQDVADHLYSYIPNISPFNWLFAVTVLSWGLYAGAFVWISFLTWRGKLNNSQSGVYIAITIIIGGFVSYWSLFVLAMSGG